MERNLHMLAEDLARLTSVEASVIVATDGTVVADTMDGDAEKEGAVAVFVGSAAGFIGDTLDLGDFDWGVVSMTKYRMLIVEQPHYFIGLLLATKASPALLASEVQAKLGASA